MISNCNCDIQLLFQLAMSYFVQLWIMLSLVYIKKVHQLVGLSETLYATNRKVTLSRFFGLLHCSWLCHFRSKCKDYHEPGWRQFARRLEILQSSIQCSKLSWFRHVCRNDTLPKRKNGGRQSSRKTAYIMEGQRQGWWTPLASHCCCCCCCCTLQTTEDDGHQSRGVCRSIPTTPGHHREFS